MHYACGISVFNVYFNDKKAFLFSYYPRKSGKIGEIEEIGKSDYEAIPNNKISHVTKIQVVTMYCTENIA